MTKPRASVTSHVYVTSLLLNNNINVHKLYEIQISQTG